MPDANRRPPTLLMHEGALPKIGEWVRATNARRALLMLGKRSFRQSMYWDRLRGALKGCDVVVSEPVAVTPSAEFVRRFTTRAYGRSIDAVIGIGGGSVMDVAKLASMVLACEADAVEECLLTRQPFHRRLPLALVPTTAGTGSEVTPYASLETDDGRKITVTDTQLFADLAIVDPLLTYSLPAAVTASTGMDALSQAVEAFWSVHHTPLSDAHALDAARLVAGSLRVAVREPGNAEARRSMARGSCEAGRAIAQTATTAVHSVSYPISTHFGVAHGHACALMLAEFIRFNETSMDEVRCRMLWQALGVESARAAADLVERLREDIGLERRLSRLGIDQDGMQVIVRDGFRPDRVRNNPRLLTREALSAMLMRVL